MRLVVGGLVSIGLAWSILNLLAHPGSIESQVSATLGCRNDDVVLVLRIETDRVRWPDGSFASFEESALLIPGQVEKNGYTVLGIVAPPETSLSLVHPLLEAADRANLRRSVLSVNRLH